MTIYSTFKNDDISIIMAPITNNTHIKWTLFDFLLEIFNALRVISVATGQFLMTLPFVDFVDFPIPEKNQIDFQKHVATDY